MKKLKIALAVCCLLLTLAACGKPFTCGLCGKESTGKKHVEKVYGEEMLLCDDCKSDMKGLFN